MFIPVHKANLRLSIIAVCVVFAGTAGAHPEMDEQGRDITSGTTAATATQIEIHETASDEMTGSIGHTKPCNRQTPQDCTTPPQQDEEMWFLGKH